MTNKELQKIIKQEGNKKEGKYKGFKWLILRHNQLLHLNGYVIIPKKNKLYGKDYLNEDSILNINVHGGITFSGSMKGINIDYMIGFDTAHLGDLSIYKELNNIIQNGDGTYRDMKYVENEIRNMIDQILKLN